MDSLIEYSGNCKIAGTKCPIPIFDSGNNYSYKVTIYYYYTLFVSICQTENNAV